MFIIQILNRETTMNTNATLSTTIETILRGIKWGIDEYKAFDKVGILDYLNTQIEKYTYVNTFLHRADKVKFKDIYFPIKIKNKKCSTDFYNPQVFLNQHKYISIFGTAGSGKSTLLKYAFLQTLQAAHKIPILIELRYLNNIDNIDIEKEIISLIVKKNIKPNSNIVKRALSSGAFLFIFDGFDEIYSFGKEKILQAIDTFIDIYPLNNYIISSRPETGLETFPRFESFYVQPLNSSDVLDFCKKMISSHELYTKIITTIQSPENDNIKSYLENPLLLSMFILVYESHPEIPKRKTAFYKNVFETLYSQHDGISKCSYKRERLSKLEREDFEIILSRFSCISYIENCYSFDYTYLYNKLQYSKQGTNYHYNVEDLISDLSLSLSILIKDGLEYKFPHRSLQEYFFALYISHLPENKKKILYTKLQNDIKQGKETYILELCDEIDHYGLHKYYITPLLKDIIKKIELSKDNSRQIIDAFFRLMQIAILNIDSKNEAFFTKGATFTQLPPFMQRNVYQSISSFIKKYIQRSEFINIFPFQDSENLQNRNHHVSFLWDNFPNKNQQYQKMLDYFIQTSIEKDILNLINEFKIYLENEKQKEADDSNFLRGIL